MEGMLTLLEITTLACLIRSKLAAVTGAELVELLVLELLLLLLLLLRLVLLLLTLVLACNNGLGAPLRLLLLLLLLLSLSLEDRILLLDEESPLPDMR